MKNFTEIGVELRRKNRKHYTLLAGCIFFSVLLITAYASIMRSPTVLAILPEGGDSRKQIMMVFVLAAVGCGAFALYSASLFFRYKSREAGIFMVLGASRKKLSRQLFQELALISGGSCLAGALLGTPAAWGVWQLFRLFVVDTEEMKLAFEPQAYLIALALTVFIMVSLFFMGVRFVRRTNIIDVVNQQHTSEPIRDVKPWYGPLGLILIIVGGLAGYGAPTVMQKVFHIFAKGWTGLLYLPLIPGLYMVLVHTVVRGWRKGKSRYKNIISRSMMKFQGRQTVNNMLILIVLIAGAYFGLAYIPIIGVSSVQEIENRSVDYMFHYRADQSMPERPEIEAMAAQDGVSVKDWKNTEFAVLGKDGTETTYEANQKIHEAYSKLLGEGNCLSESGYRELSGQSADIRPGSFARVVSEDSADEADAGSMLLTNMTTRKTLPLTVQQNLRFPMLASTYSASYYVLDDADYGKITAGLGDGWKEKLIFFNGGESGKSYAFAKRLFNILVDRSGPECELGAGYDRVEKIVAEEAGKTYWGDEAPEMTKVSYKQRDSSVFRRNWKYMPKFRVLDRNSYVATNAVFLMLFAFVTIICFGAVLLIGYTRCVTIAMNNRQVYDDLRRLGASPGYLYRSVRGQVAKTFGIPGFTGTLIIFLFTCMILFFNDGRFTGGEISGLVSFLYLILALSAVLCIFTGFTLRRVCKMLGIKTSGGKSK